MSTTGVSEDHLWSSLVAFPADEQAEGIQRALAEYVQMAMETLPADEAGPSVAEALAEFAQMAMETLPADEAGVLGVFFGVGRVFWGGTCLWTL